MNWYSIVLLLMNLSEWDRESLRYAHDNNMESLYFLWPQLTIILKREERTKPFFLLMVVEKRRELVDCRIPT